MTARALALPVLILAAIAAGAALRARPATAELGWHVWTVSLWILGARLAWRTTRHAFAGHFATDVVAALAIIAAVLLGEPLAGLIVVLMQTGGEALEEHARGRASEALRSLEESAPRLAHVVAGGAIRTVPAEQVVAGDLLLIRPGEPVPCDGEVVDGESHVDTARLTGEPLPMRATARTRLASGMTNVEGSLTVRATAPAARSQYARIVELVRLAQATRAPMQRLADRYAIWFTPITLLACAVTYLITRDPTRVLAILVVATPCPLILAVPVALIGGVNAAARRQVIIRSAGALETLARTSAAVFDKTGTLTVGSPSVRRVVVGDGMSEKELLRVAAAVEQGSSHPLARAVVDAAQAAGVVVPAAHVIEVPGRGVAGTVDGREVLLGARGFILGRLASSGGLAGLDAATTGLRAWIAVDGAPAGVLEFADELRPGARTIAADLRRLGISRLSIRSGDAHAHTLDIAREVGIDDAQGDLLPEEKLHSVKALADEGEHVLMVGDGMNDAPALGTAGVGIALASHVGGITAEAADVVVLADDLGRVVTVIRIARRTVRIARESAWVGLGLSAVAMVFAALGRIPPVTGALLQEVIDIVVILNAVRSSRLPQDQASAGSRAGIPDRSQAPFLTEPVAEPR